MAHDHAVDAAEATESLNPSRAISPVYEDYFDLQTALAADDLEASEEPRGGPGARSAKST